MRPANPVRSKNWSVSQKHPQMRSAFYRHFEQANQAGASLNGQSSSSVFVDQAGDKSRAVQHLAGDAEGTYRKIPLTGKTRMTSAKREVKFVAIGRLRRLQRVHGGP